MDWLNVWIDKFVNDFIVDQRWRYITDGLITTMKITVFALLFGILLGIIVSVVRTAHDQTGKKQLKGSLFGWVLIVLNAICKAYLTIIRGTPALVQLMIMYYIIFGSSNNKVLAAVLCFGINSGAYVAEIFRSGIMSIDKGQMEAGRSLGLDYVTTMQKIIIPQAVKNVLPALVNEMITLLKETSICGYVGLNELTRGGDIIRGRTYDAFLPLLVVAAIYLILVMFFTWIMSLIERRLRASDIR